jgi:transposase
MSKGRYSATPIKKFSPEKLQLRPGARVVISIDVAKDKQFAAISNEAAGVVERLSWSHPAQTPAFFELIEGMRALGADLQAVLEPTGTYGDALVAGLRKRDIAVFQAKGKQVHDAREVFDRVPSLHDGKSTDLLLHLHRAGASTPWKERSEAERADRAAVNRLALHEERYRMLLNKLEAELARHWPELTEFLGLTKKTLRVLVSTYGGPAEVVADTEGARALMMRVGRSFLDAKKVEAVLESARTTVGVPMAAEERAYVQELATEAEEAHGRAERAYAELEKRSARAPAEMTRLTGTKLAVVLMATGLDPREYESPKAFEKGLGLNLREKSSGRVQGRGVHITKRGNGFARQLLYYAALRLLKDDAVVRAWYGKKVERDGGRAKTRAVVAVMRKMARALWHVARDKKFDASLLFDTARLGDRLVPANAQETAA